MAPGIALETGGDTESRPPGGKVGSFFVGPDNPKQIGGGMHRIPSRAEGTLGYKEKPSRNVEGVVKICAVSLWNYGRSYCTRIFFCASWTSFCFDFHILEPNGIAVCRIASETEKSETVNEPKLFDAGGLTLAACKVPHSDGHVALLCRIQGELRPSILSRRLRRYLINPCARSQ